MPDLNFLYIFSIGLISSIFLLLTIITGSAAKFALKLKDRIKPIFIKLIHNVVALMTFTGGMTAIILAYRTKSWLDFGGFTVTMICINSLITILTLIGTLKTIWSHVRTITLRRYIYQLL